jgi:hypothetical protein
MTIDQMVEQADLAAAAIRRLQQPRSPSIAQDLRPRRRRHRRTPIEYRMSPMEFVISGTASAVLGGIFTLAVAQILWGSL